jgi:hypothetical protein
MGDEIERAKFSDAAQAILYAVRILGQQRRVERDANNAKARKPSGGHDIGFVTQARYSESLHELIKGLQELVNRFPDFENVPIWYKSMPGKYQVDLNDAVDLISHGLECEGASLVGYGWVAFVFSHEKVDELHNASISAAWELMQKRLPPDMLARMGNLELKEVDGRLIIDHRSPPD